LKDLLPLSDLATETVRCAPINQSHLSNRTYYNQTAFVRGQDLVKSDEDQSRNCGATIAALERVFFVALLRI
jgi:hypothetical protein